MSSLARSGAFFRAAATPNPAEVEGQPSEASARRDTTTAAGGNDRDNDVVIIGQAQRRQLHAPGSLASLPALIEAAEARAAGILREAEARAAALVRAAEVEAESLRAAARAAGYEAGHADGAAAATAELDALVSLARAACADGKALRDQVAATSMSVLASAVALATRRIAGEWYDADPARTAAICAEALSAASGQEILSLRVHSSVSGHVQAVLGSAATYVRPDDGVAVGGCIIDLASGTIDATVDTRLSLLELGLQHAAGAAP